MSELFTRVDSSVKKVFLHYGQSFPRSPQSPRENGTNISPHLRMLFLGFISPFCNAVPADVLLQSYRLTTGFRMQTKLENHTTSCHQTGVH